MSTNLEISLNEKYGNNTLYFKFTGQFTEKTSSEGTKEWGEILKSNPNTSYTLIWDCTLMEGFDIAARKDWYKTMKLYKPQIFEVIVVSKSIMIRGAARVMLDLFGVRSRIMKTEEELILV